MTTPDPHEHHWTDAPDDEEAWYCPSCGVTEYPVGIDLGHPDGDYTMYHGGHPMTPPDPLRAALRDWLASAGQDAIAVERLVNAAHDWLNAAALATDTAPLPPLDVETFIAGIDSPNHSPESRRAWIALFYRDMGAALAADPAPLDVERLARKVADAAMNFDEAQRSYVASLNEPRPKVDPDLNDPEVAAEWFAPWNRQEEANQIFRATLNEYRAARLTEPRP